MSRRKLIRVGAAVAISVGSTILAAAAWEVAEMAPPTAGELARLRLGESGVEHPVTAVLLNFRAYDTFLEILVLTVAFWGVWSLEGSQKSPFFRPPGLLLERVTAVLVPMLVLLAAYLLWAGSHRPGGEFQAGAVLGAAGILTLLVGHAVPGAHWHIRRRLVVVAGVGTFVVVAVAGAILAGHVFAYRPGWEMASILVLEVTTALSVGFILTALFAGDAEGLHGESPPQSAKEDECPPT